MTTDFTPNPALPTAAAPTDDEGLNSTAKAVGAILSIVAWVASGILALGGLISLLGGLFNGNAQTLLIGVVMAVVAAVTWAQLMLFALVAKYIAARTR